MRDYFQYLFNELNEDTKGLLLEVVIRLVEILLFFVKHILPFIIVGFLIAMVGFGVSIFK